MNYKNVFDDLVISEDSKVTGNVMGDILVKENIELKVTGNVQGDIIMKKNAKMKITGNISGDVVMHEDTYLKSTGNINGDVVKIGKGAEIKNTGNINGSVLNEKGEKEETKKKNEYIIGDGIRVVDDKINIKGKNNNITGNIFGSNINIGSDNVSMYSSNAGGNVMYSGNKRIVLKNPTGPCTMMTKNNKTYVNGVDLDTVTPDENGIYYV